MASQRNSAMANSKAKALRDLAVVEVFRAMDYWRTHVPALIDD